MNTTDRVVAIPGQDSIYCVLDAEDRSTFGREPLAEILTKHPEAKVYIFQEWLNEAAARQQSVGIRWLPTTPETFNDMLEVLPPIEFSGDSFLVGEPTDHCFATGAPRFTAYRRRGGRGPFPALYQVCARPLTVAEFRKARYE